jgi:hypothetical protein
MRTDIGIHNKRLSGRGVDIPSWSVCEHLPTLQTVGSHCLQNSSNSPDEQTYGILHEISACRSAVAFKISVTGSHLTNKKQSPSERTDPEHAANSTK